MEQIGLIYMPGDILENLKVSDNSKKTQLGPGLRQKGDDIFVTKPGILKFREPNVYWIDSHQKRYVPQRGENVLGIVTAKGGDVFKVDVGGSEQASLSYLAFEGATKRNRPDVKIGDMVYGKFLVANKDMEPEMICIDGTGRGTGLGVIRSEGLIFTCSLNLIRKLLSPGCKLLQALGNSLPYEIAIGMNGRIWAKGRSTTETIAVCNAISNAEYLENDQVKPMVKKLVDALSTF